jgi:hypothetical protein
MPNAREGSEKPSWPTVKGQSRIPQADANVPTSGDPDVDLYFAIYTSLLRNSGSFGWRFNAWKMLEKLERRMGWA